MLVIISASRGEDLTASLTGPAAAALLALGGSLPRASRVALASMVTLSLFTSTALLIHTFHGLIELHFHFFVVIAVVAMYQQWTPYLLGLAYVAVHHGVIGVMMPMAVYNHHAAVANPVIFAIVHACFVLAESIACLAYWKVTEQALDAEREQRAVAEEASLALVAANREMADLMAMVSHDLRTPLTVINSAAEMALDSWPDLDDGSRRAFMQRVGTAGHSLQEMLEETLTMSALDAEGLPTRPVAVRVDEFIRTLLESLPISVDEFRLDGLAASTAMVDRQQLAQIVTNLVTNATKYGAAPYVLRVVSRQDLVEVVVRDSGTGVPASFVPRLFDRYARADEARRGDQRGTGLGLHIVQQLALANGGSVSYRDGDEGGAEFVVRLRRAPRLCPPEDDPGIAEVRMHALTGHPESA